MKAIILAALAALTCPIWAQSTPGPNMPAIHERPSAQDKPGTRTLTPGEARVLKELGPDMTMTNSMATAPALTPEQKLAIRDAQVPMLTASREFQAYMQTIQKQLESLPEYVKLKAAAETASAKFQAVAQEAVKKTCADCQLDVETLNLTRPQQAKVEKPTEKK